MGKTAVELLHGELSSKRISVRTKLSRDLPQVLVSVRRVLESSESVVIQGRWPDSTRGSPDVDERKPRAL